MDVVMAIAIFGTPAFITLIVVSVCITIALLVHTMQGVIENDEDFRRVFEPIKKICFIVLSILIISITMLALPSTFIDYQKYKLIRHYTDDKVVKEQLEPIVKGYLDTIQKTIADPTFTIKLENKDK